MLIPFIVIKTLQIWSNNATIKAAAVLWTIYSPLVMFPCFEKP